LLLSFTKGVKEDFTQNPHVVTHICGIEIDPHRIYRVATKIGDLTNGQSPPWTEYYTEHPELLPPKGAYVNIQAELMAYFARNLWRNLWDALSDKLNDCGVKKDECNPKARMAELDEEGSGVVTVDNIQSALRDLLGYSVDDREKSLAKFVHSFADRTSTGKVTLLDLKVQCAEMEEFYEQQDKWRLAFPKKPNPSVASSA
jgi:hypothetical protein